MITPQQIIDISSHLSKIHHIKGRLRLRVSPKIKEQSNGVTLHDIKRLPEQINGIKGIKINKIIGSITIDYDHTIFPYELWEDLLNRRNLETISQLLNELSKEVITNG